MLEHPFIWDIVFLVLVMPVLEAVILRKNYRILSPVTMFYLGTMVLYVIPYLSHFYFSPDWRLGLLDNQQFKSAFNILRCFLYTYTLVSIPLLYKAAKSEQTVLNLNYPLIKKRTAFVFVFFCVVVFLMLGVGVGFSPGAMIDRAIHPREYTFVRAGVGPLTHLHWGMRFVVCALAAAMIFLSRKSLLSIIFFAVCAFVTFLGGTKSSFVLPVFVFIVIWQKMNYQWKSAFTRFRRTIQIGMCVALLVIVGFLIMKGRQEQVSTLKDAAVQAVHYHKEAFYLPLVPQEFPWKIEYPLRLIADTFRAPIPRAIWPSKPPVGLWQVYFRPVFEPDTVFYHTSTFGCLSEAHMLFGRLGPFVYGLIWAWITYKLYQYMISGRSLFKAFWVGTMSFWTYLLLRTGFLEVNSSILLLYAFLGWVCLRKTEESVDNEDLESDQNDEEDAEHGSENFGAVDKTVNPA